MLQFVHWMWQVMLWHSVTHWPYNCVYLCHFLSKQLDFLDAHRHGLCNSEASSIEKFDTYNILSLTPPKIELQHGNLMSWLAYKNKLVKYTYQIIYFYYGMAHRKLRYLAVPLSHLPSQPPHYILPNSCLIIMISSIVGSYTLLGNLMALILDNNNFNSWKCHYSAMAHMYTKCTNCTPNYRTTR